MREPIALARTHNRGFPGCGVSSFATHDMFSEWYGMVPPDIGSTNLTHHTRSTIDFLRPGPERRRAAPDHPLPRSSTQTMLHLVASPARSEPNRQYADQTNQDRKLRSGPRRSKENWCNSSIHAVTSIGAMPIAQSCTDTLSKSTLFLSL